MTSPKPTERLSGRTKLITATSVVAVVIASLFAVAANLGILNNADRSSVGTLSATGDLTTADAPARSRSQVFRVDTAGTVTVSPVDGRARVDRIRPAAGWSARAVEASGAEVAVSFTDGTRTLEFTATVAADGSVVGDITDASPGAARASSRRDDESIEHEEEEYEGGDSDD
jgi:hypothetical protein